MDIVPCVCHTFIRWFKYRVVLLQCSEVLFATEFLPCPTITQVHNVFHTHKFQE